MGSRGYEGELEELARLKPLNDSLKPCPFCGCGNAYLQNGDVDGAREVICESVKCGARGPDRSSDEAAAAAWNERRIERM